MGFELIANILLGGTLVVLLFVMQNFARSVQQLADIVREMEDKVEQVQRKVAVHEYILRSRGAGDAAAG